ncbi:hypothetical protein [Edaphobacter modestus]|uniref:Rap1a immunity protein domain-containing protein n=1 Tax=Edaphobacter modestus TaxID=388466 RepID=A0A4Q7YU62_9BACT|nr:hypothetical protein [Edaphobacter modestus]RZU41120.1 hypothetical protein BDD14_2618 [Edaphobacter modestus]
MRLILLAICVIFASVMPAHSQGRESAATEAIVCGDPVNTPDCKMYVSGFADIVQMIFAVADPKKTVCNDLSNFLYEFIHEVQTNPEARKKDTQHVLYDLLTRDATCDEVKVRDLTAGHFIDTCLAGDIGFDLCSGYRMGATDALFLLDEGKDHALCGDKNLAFNVIPQMKLKLEADYKLRARPASEVITRVLFSLMPCPKDSH